MDFNLLDRIFMPLIVRLSYLSLIMQLLVGVRALTTPRLKHSATKSLHLSVSCEGVRSQSVAIVGGGLAGLSTAFHLLKKDPDTSITIFDTKSPGLGGASSVAGG